jgi:hypothetical protein
LIDASWTPAELADPTLGRAVEGGPDAPPLFFPDEAFPPYRFVPGVTPHPSSHVAGYQHGKPHDAPPFLPAERWAENHAYLRATDYFNRGWWWEAHEQWEDLWHVVEGVDESQHILLKALIQFAACALNLERGKDRPSARLLGTATDYLRQAGSLAGSDWLLGLHLPSVARAASQHLVPGRDRIDGFVLTPTDAR